MKKRILILTLIGVFLFSVFCSFASAQSPYQTQTIPITLDSSGTFSGSAQDIGVIFYVQGTAGATGSVTTQLYTANPQPTASIPDGISLTRFIGLTFNMNPTEFTQATIYITYTEADVATLQAPYSVYKYDSASNSYVLMSSNVDTATKMITVTANSIDDPLFAIGGTPIQDNGGFSTTAWATLAVSIIIIVLLVVVGVWYFKKRSK